MGMNPEGRESLVVVAKGTYVIPEEGEEARLCEQQEPLVEADSFTGEPGLSAPVYESDYAPFKPRCDVLLNGSAYAPGGRAVTKVPVTLKVAGLTKSFNVVGNRCWHKSLMGISVSSPEPFTVMPLSYDNAFGGTDNSHEKADKHQAFMPNPIGVGFHSNQEAKAIKGQPLPNTEQIGKSVRKPTGYYQPMSFGPVGRGWESRLKHAGTYDQNWLDNIFPFLPPDFKDDYFQSAPLDQQVRYLKGGEKVELINMTPQGKTCFILPKLDLPVVFFLKNYDRNSTQMFADTLLIEPDKGRFMVTWRTSLPLKRNMFEVVQVVVGEMSRGWWRAREMGKTYYRSLASLAREKSKDAQGENV